MAVLEPLVRMGEVRELGEDGDSPVFGEALAVPSVRSAAGLCRWLEPPGVQRRSKLNARAAPNRASASATTPGTVSELASAVSPAPPSTVDVAIQAQPRNQTRSSRPLAGLRKATISSSAAATAPTSAIARPAHNT